MLECKESDGTLQRTVSVTIKPTPTETADAIWNMLDGEQVMLLCYLKRRFCNSTEGLMQMGAIANRLDKVSKEMADEAKAFVRCLADYVLGDEK
jgi:hypothetical protein